MKRLLLILLITVAALTGCIWRSNPDRSPVACTQEAKICPDGSAVGRIGPNCEFAPCPQIPPGTCTTTTCTAPSDIITDTSSVLVPPVAEFLQRITKKPFGIYITLNTSPVQPERFTGYHTGTDVEYSNVLGDVPVHAIADGTVVYSGTINGYGGVVAVRHVIQKQTYIAIYGHLDAATLIKNGATVTAGEWLGVLGDGLTTETDGERKHLHLGIHKGVILTFTGYVKTKSALDAWIDPISLF